MSERKKLQDELVTFLEARDFNAPYGILVGLRPLPRGGKVREITFGKAATLDCTVQIWNREKISVAARGPLAQHLDEHYGSLAALKKALAKISVEEIQTKRKAVED